MSISVTNRHTFRAALAFLAVALLCIVFNLVYARYSHGVSSGYMTFAFAYPLLGGALVYLLLGAAARPPGRLAVNAYNSGLAALTVGSLLRGIFEIAGTASPYQPVFTIAGILLTAVGAISYLATRRKRP